MNRMNMYTLGLKIEFSPLPSGEGEGGGGGGRGKGGRGKGGRLNEVGSVRHKSYSQHRWNLQ